MPAKPIVIGTHKFLKKADATVFFREMLNRYDLGDEVAAEDAEALLSALAVESDRVVQRLS